MFNFDYITKEDIKEHNPNWPEFPDHPYRILIVGGSVSGKTNGLFNLIDNEPDIDKMYLYAKDPYEGKYKLLTNKRESIGFDSKALKKLRILVVFDDMIADMLSNKKLNPIVTELFIRGRKINISLVFITQSYFAVPKNIRLNSTHYFVIPNKRELQQIAFNHSRDIDLQYFMNLYKKCTAKPFSFLVIDATLAPIEKNIKTNQDN